MSTKLKVVSGKHLIKLLQSLGFILVRVKGSHHRLKHKDRRVTTVPVHKNDNLAKGLLHKIITQDIQISIEIYNKLVDEL